MRKKQRSLFNIALDAAANPAAIIAQIQAVAEKADTERLTVLVDEFKRSYPDLYDSINGLVDRTPQDAVSELIRKYPFLTPIKFIKGHLKTVEVLQANIRARREPQ